MKLKFCHYRKCLNILIDKRSDAKYCCRECKQCEKDYRKRDKNLKSKSLNNLIS